MYIIMEIQKNNDGSIGVPPIITKEDRNEAESEYCSIRAVAAISKLPQHTVIMMEDNGKLYDFKCYTHEKEK